MVSPGSKNWIKKYYSLIEQGKISLDLSGWVDDSSTKRSHQIRRMAEASGLIYGAANKLIFINSQHLNLTEEEQLKLLLFEALIFVYLLHHKEPFNPKTFNTYLERFYSIETIVYDHKWYNFLEEKGETINLERLFAGRIKVKSNYTERNFWFNHLSNGLLYLDLILFHAFCGHQEPTFNDRYDSYGEIILRTTYAGIKLIPENFKPLVDQTLLKNLLASADLNKNISVTIKQSTFEQAAVIESIEYLKTHPLLANFCYQLWVLILHHADKEQFNEIESHVQFIDRLFIDKSDALGMYWDLRTAIDEHAPVSRKLSDSETLKLTSYLSKRYIKILGRNKDKFIQELKESKELIQLVKKSMKEELTPEEKQAVKSQFNDLLKSVPSIGIFLIPGGSLLLPLILKLIPDLLPTAFQENEVRENK